MLARSLRPRRDVRPLALACAALALAPLGDVEPDNAGSCVLRGGSLRVYEGSRLFDTRDGRLTLARGRALPCDRGVARDVRAAIEAAIGAHIDAAVRGAIDERLAAPLHVHVDPRLPASQAALGGIEVHVSSRELLVARAALAELPERAWRHELLHALAPPPPPLSRAARQLWLTLEEGLVAFSTDGAGAAVETWRAGEDPAPGRATHPGPPPLPLIEWLESPAYDPHPLAAGLARELAGTGADAAALLDCLTLAPARVQHQAPSAFTVVGREVSSASARDTPYLPEARLPPGALSELPAELADVFLAFRARCSAGAQVDWTAAIERWWGTPPASRGPLHAPGKAAAPARESR